MAKKQSAFERFLNEPQTFSEDLIVLSREKYDREGAAVEINAALGEDGELEYLNFDHKIKPADLKEDAVRFMFHDGGIDCQSPCWVLGQEGVGSKKVWVYGY